MNGERVLSAGFVVLGLALCTALIIAVMVSKFESTEEREYWRTPVAEALTICEREERGFKALSCVSALEKLPEEFLRLERPNPPVQ